MSKKVLIISGSLRSNSNSELLAKEVEQGALAAGNEVEFVSLKDKDIRFCRGCLACQKIMKCVINDDVADIMKKVKAADTLVFATPVYYYGMCGQLKTLLDRLNPLFPQAYSFRDIYVLTASAEEGDEVIEGTVSGINGWIDCFEHARFAGVFNGGGLTATGEAQTRTAMREAAFEFGKNL